MYTCLISKFHLALDIQDNVDKIIFFLIYFLNEQVLND